MFGLGFMIGALIGFGYALYVNESWYKHCLELTDSWDKFTQHIIDVLSREDGDG